MRHEIPTSAGVVTIIEQPMARVSDTPYPGVYLAHLNALWHVRYTLIEPGEDEGRRTLMITVPCGLGYQSAPPDNTLSMIAQDAMDTVWSTPDELEKTSGAEFTAEQWREIHKVWRGWHVALGEFLGSYHAEVMDFLTV